MIEETRTLHEALAENGITHGPHHISGKRELIKDGVTLGVFDVWGGWDFVHALEKEKANV